MNIFNVHLPILLDSELPEDKDLTFSIKQMTGPKYVMLRRAEQCAHIAS